MQPVDGINVPCHVKAEYFDNEKMTWTKVDDLPTVRNFSLRKIILINMKFQDTILIGKICSKMRVTFYDVIHFVNSKEKF